MKPNLKKFFEELDKDKVMQIAYETHLTYHAIRVWKNRGIPEKHWAFLMERYGLTLQELHAHNESVRK